MAHCPPGALDDLADVLVAVRSWSGVVEKSSGVFYVGREPFLHFHLLADGRRRADVKGRTEWVEIDLPRPASASRRAALLRRLETQYAAKRSAPAR
jgi:hypothetical protein